MARALPDSTADAAASASTRIGLSVQSAVPLRRPQDLDHRFIPFDQESRQASPVTAGPLDPEYDDPAQPLRPTKQVGIAGRAGRDFELIQVPTQLILGFGEMRVLVGVDSNDYIGFAFCDACCCHRPPRGEMDWWSAAGRADSTAMGFITNLLSGHCSLGTDS